MIEAVREAVGAFTRLPLEKLNLLRQEKAALDQEHAEAMRSKSHARGNTAALAKWERQSEQRAERSAKLCEEISKVEKKVTAAADEDFLRAALGDRSHHARLRAATKALEEAEVELARARGEFEVADKAREKAASAAAHAAESARAAKRAYEVKPTTEAWDVRTKASSTLERATVDVTAAADRAKALHKPVAAAEAKAASARLEFAEANLPKLLDRELVSELLELGERMAALLARAGERAAAARAAAIELNALRRAAGLAPTEFRTLKGESLVLYLAAMWSVAKRARTGAAPFRVEFHRPYHGVTVHFPVEGKSTTLGLKALAALGEAL